MGRDYSRRRSGDYSPGGGRSPLRLWDGAMGRLWAHGRLLGRLSGLLDELAGRVHIEVAMT